MKKIAILFCIISTMYVFGQQEPHFTQYFDNTLIQNPAYAGSNKLLSMNAIHREQWIGFEGRPSTTSFLINSPLKYESVGLGLSAVRDVIGPTTQHMVYADFSYSLRLNNKRSLAFGLKGGFNLINTQTHDLSTVSGNDPSLMQNTLNRFNPNFGFGMYYHGPKFFIGLSSPKLLENSLDGTSSNLERRHYYLHSGLLIAMSPNWKLRPSIQIKSTIGAPLSLDGSLALIYKDRIYLGGMYRYLSAAGAFCQYQITDQVRIGIASDFALTPIRNYNQGTFEVLLSYDFNFIKGGIRSPRYF